MLLTVGYFVYFFKICVMKFIEPHIRLLTAELFTLLNCNITESNTVAQCHSLCWGCFMLLRIIIEMCILLQNNLE
jgi:hypothetical protein